MDYKSLPKAELHCHLDGSVRIKTIIELSQKLNLELPSFDEEELANFFKQIGKTTGKAAHYNKFEIQLKVMQSKENFARVIDELIEDCSKENIKYIEIRFAPRVHLQEEMSIDDVLEIFNNQINLSSKKYNIIAKGLLCFRRQTSKKGIKEILDKASKYLQDSIVGIDIVGMEEQGFVNEYINEVKYAQKLGYKITVHAGEMLNSNNVMDAINLMNVNRIGHGFMISNDTKQVNLLKQKQIPVETCPTSNIKRLDFNWKNHPAKKYFDLGIPISLNTDNRTLNLINLTNEIKIAFEKLGFTKQDYKQVYIDTINASFATTKEKKELLKFSEAI